MTMNDSLLVTDQDYERLVLLLQNTNSPLAAALEEELGRATIIAQKEIPPDIVTMNSTVAFVALETDKESEITLVYPKDADVTKACISVLAPVGVALLGLRIGQAIEWPMPNGERRHLKVTGIKFQPEAAGNWDL